MKTRSLLFIPANDLRKIEKGLHSEADIVIFDLEDAIARSEKETARQVLKQLWLNQAKEQRKPEKESNRTSVPQIFVRINCLRTPDGIADLQCCYELGIRKVILPKTESASDILELLATWSSWTQDSLDVIALIETALGVEHAYEIAQAHPSVRHLALGSVDLSLDLGIDLEGEQDELLYTRSRLVIASRAARILPPIDAVYMKIKDETGFLIQANRSKKLGFAGKMIIHPAHIALVHQVWQADADRLEKDYRIVHAFEQALKQGIAAIQVDGQMIDEPVYQAARNRIGNQQAMLDKED
jgi:citrate lyase subunit beta/citryl-CoA lyase